MKEEWKTIETSKTKYEISNFGNVKINDVLQKFESDQYIKIGLGWLHRVIAELFIPNPDNKPEIDHIDGNISNNRADNLRWVTHSENMLNPITREKQSKVQSITQKQSYKDHPERAINHSKTMIEKWNNDKEEILNKIKQTNLEKYGVDSYSKTKEAKEKQSIKTKKLWENKDFRQKMIEASHTEEIIKKHSNLMKENWKNEEFRNKQQKAWEEFQKREDYIKWKESISESSQGENNGFYGKHHSEEQRKKWSEKRKGQFKGWRFINNNKTTKFVNPLELEQYLNNGWELGRFKKNKQ